jgi:hypothetical protein
MVPFRGTNKTRHFFSFPVSQASVEVNDEVNDEVNRPKDRGPERERPGALFMIDSFRAGRRIISQWPHSPLSSSKDRALDFSTRPPPDTFFLWGTPQGFVRLICPAWANNPYLWAIWKRPSRRSHRLAVRL